MEGRRSAQLREVEESFGRVFERCDVVPEWEEEPEKPGNNVFIGPNCTISTAGHPFEVKLRREGLEYAKSITIGSNVWIGMGTQICPGVTIGDNAVIGAGSVVTGDVPAGWLAFGNPCKPVKAVEEKPVRRIL